MCIRDSRKGTLSSHVHVSAKGVTNYLSGRIDNVEEIIRQNELCDKLDIIHAGPVPPNPAELLLGDRLETLIAELRKRYDLSLIHIFSVCLTPTRSVCPGTDGWSWCCIRRSR